MGRGADFAAGGARGTSDPESWSFGGGRWRWHACSPQHQHAPVAVPLAAAERVTARGEAKGASHAPLDAPDHGSAGHRRAPHGRATGAPIILQPEPRSVTLVPRAAWR